MVAAERCIDVYVNGEHYATFLASPTMEKELVVGHMLSEGFIRSIEDLGEVHASEGKVEVSLRVGIRPQLKVVKDLRLFTSSQGSYDDFSKTLEELNRPLVSSDLKVKAEDVLRMIEQLNRKSRVYKATKGVHSAALFLGNAELVSFSEDVSRHNAVDKVIGDAALKQKDFSKLTLVSSARQVAHLVLKAARVGIPIIASIASPIFSGVMAAKKAGITLISVTSKQSIKVYTFQDRIVI
jgi:FdhD protein